MKKVYFIFFISHFLNKTRKIVRAFCSYKKNFTSWINFKIKFIYTKCIKHVKLYVIFIKIDYLKFSYILCFLYNNQKDYKNCKFKSFAYNNLIRNNTPFLVLSKIFSQMEQIAI